VLASGLDLSRLLNPRSVVVVGATDRPGSYSAQTLLNLQRAGFDGPVIGVHPSRDEVLGVACVRSLPEAAERLDGPPDAVVIATRAPTVTGYVDVAGRLGCGGAVVYAAGFGESGDPAAQQRLTSTARRHDLPLLGPNANGFVSVAARAPLWGDAVTLPERAGTIGLITQSGNVGVLALAHRAGLGLHSVVSLGNAAVIDAPAVLSHLAGIGGLRAVALYLEDDGDGARLAVALAACARADVRVAVLKAGRSREGREAAGAHTAALAGDHRVFAALIEQAGGVLTRDPYELLETARALAGGHRTKGKLAVLTASGADAAITADLAADAGVALAGLEPITRERLGALLPHTATVTNPLDHTNLVWADTEAIAGLTAALAADPLVGPVIYVQDEPPGLPPVDAAEWAATRAGAELGARRAGIEVMLVATMPGQEPPPAISGLRPALAAIAALDRPAPDPARLTAIADACARPTPRAGTATATGTTTGATTATGTTTGTTWLAEHEAKALLAEAGIPSPTSAVLPLKTSPVIMHACPNGIRPNLHDHGENVHDHGEVEAAVRAADGLGFPVVLKVSAPGLLHKSEAGALALDLRDADQVREAARSLLAGPAASTPAATLLIERMAAPGIELVIAAHRDGVVPALVIGLGGIWAESLDDVVVLPLPVEPAEVIDAALRLRAAAVLTGGRGRPSVDLAAIGTIGARIGELLLSEGFSLIEVNPLVAGPDGAVAVDALARR
jgi:acetyl-CoA synthetase